MTRNSAYILPISQSPIRPIAIVHRPPTGQLPKPESHYNPRHPPGEGKKQMSFEFESLVLSCPGKPKITPTAAAGPVLTRVNAELRTDLFTHTVLAGPAGFFVDRIFHESLHALARDDRECLQPNRLGRRRYWAALARSHICHNAGCFRGESILLLRRTAILAVP
jgi:hypothetical protein